ncbi:hypothetical protein [Amycolatopsis sp. NPDC051903]|uniref:hypothetical protein n=1 Tax=Amycolatopsis sp. NPDC051903 TaxID=3363936 RepID=UPI003798D922
MSITLDHRLAPAGSHAGHGAGTLCQHEFADGGLCAHTAAPGTTRCPGHCDDGQPDYIEGGAR